MAHIEARTRTDGEDSYRVQWRDGGRHGRSCSETFTSEAAARRFKVDVEAAGNRWPAGWTPGLGFAATTTTEIDITISFEEFALAYVEQVLEALSRAPFRWGFGSRSGRGVGHVGHLTTMLGPRAPCRCRAPGRSQPLASLAHGERWPRESHHNGWAGPNARQVRQQGEGIPFWWAACASVTRAG
jgi:hypothetical protein